MNSIDEERKKHCYLGDGVYAERTAHAIILRTGDHRDEFCCNTIFLDADVIRNLIDWMEYSQK